MSRPACSEHYRDASSHLSPLRYPGGKRKLANFMRLLLRKNDLLDGDYVEVYAGGAAVALTLLFGEYVRRVHINDIDRGVHAFWLACRDRTDELCALIDAARLDIDEWRRQRAIQTQPEPDPLDLAFSTFYLNRTNRSGIVTGGPIGGYAQTGAWSLSARFTKKALIARIEKVGRHASRIHIHGLEGADVLRTLVPALPERTLVYLDPPYYVKGQELLYKSYYEADDHAEVAGLVKALPRPWVVSYDDVPEIRQLYAGTTRTEYGIRYSAHRRYQGREVMFFAPELRVPDLPDPTAITSRQLWALERAQ